MRDQSYAPRRTLMERLSHTLTVILGAIALVVGWTIIGPTVGPAVAPLINGLLGQPQTTFNTQPTSSAFDITSRDRYGDSDDAPAPPAEEAPPLAAPAGIHAPIDDAAPAELVPGCVEPVVNGWCANGVLLKDVPLTAEEQAFEDAGSGPAVQVESAAPVESRPVPTPEPNYRRNTKPWRK